MTVKLLTDHQLEFQSLKRGCTSLSESTLVKYHIVGSHMSQLILSLCLPGVDHVLTLGDFDLTRFNILLLHLPGVDHVLTLGDFDLTRFNILSLC